MKMKVWSVIVLVYCVLCWSVPYTAETIITLPGNETIPALILFGDSIVDTGTNNNNIFTVLKCNFPPYGRDFVDQVATGRFSNGKVPADLIAEGLGINEYVPPFVNIQYLQPADLLKGLNFASGGSGYDPLTSQLLFVTSLSEQLYQFKEYIGKLKSNFGEEKTNFILSKSLILVVSSSNDIANTYFAIGARKVEYDIPSYTDLLVHAASSFVKELHKLGARRIGVFGAPPLGCLPFIRTLFGGPQRVCIEEINTASMLFNSKLSSQLHKLNQSLPQAKVVYVHIYDAVLDIIQNPKKYGFEVVDKGCCGTGTVEVGFLCNELKPTCKNDSKYVFWDSYHPTQATYQIIVNGFIKKYINKFV